MSTQIMKWEYMTEIIPIKETIRDTEDRLNRLGMEGWELIAQTMGIPSMVLIFKRPLP